MIKALCLLGYLVFVAQAQATTLPYKSFDDLVREADGIVEATVENITARRTEQSGIQTYVTLSDLRLHKGTYNGDRLTLILEGGLVEGRGTYVHGSPSFREGERVIAFTEGNGQRLVPLVGWEQGLFRVVTNPETGEQLIADSVGNRVFGIENGRIVKEARVGTEAEILGEAPIGFQESREPRFSPGQPDDASPGNQPPAIQGDVGRQSALPGQTGGVMQLDRFVERIQEVVGRIEPQAAARPLASVAVGSAPPRGEQRDASPPQTDVQRDALRTAPQEQGELPIRLQTGPESNHGAQ